MCNGSCRGLSSLTRGQVWVVKCDKSICTIILQIEHITLSGHVFLAPPGGGLE